ncbi:hypothetical protein [Pollutibacter soli]|uniref:hypothetical protein n=1 Tax=Pollutibacter soli TaxID=3034157 RepID=UPI003013A1F8
MQISKENKTALLIGALIILAYAPLSGFVFGLKNDAFTDYFPPKFFLGETLKEGRLPLWNPYLNFGFPVYGDMNIGYWNPVTWIVAGTWGYNAYSFTLETIIYLVLSGIGFYKLTSIWNWSRLVRINSSLSYACCGFIVGHLQHFNWISSMAWFPFLLYFFLRYLSEGSIKPWLGFSVSLYLFFTAAHPGIIIGAFYFIMIIFLYDILRVRKFTAERNSYLKRIAILIISSVVVLAGPMYAYLEVLPVVNRGEKLLFAETGEPSGWQTWISLLLPLASTKNDAFFNSDISMRNQYLGLASLIFLVFSFRKKILKEIPQWLTITIFFFVLCSGTFFSRVLYAIIPGVGYVRLLGEYTIFSLFGSIVLAGYAFDHYINSDRSRNVEKIITAIRIFLVLLLLFAIGAAVYTKESLVFTAVSQEGSGMRSVIKHLADSLSFYDAIYIQCLLQLFILYFLYKKIHSNNNALMKWMVIDLLLATLMNLPFTGVGIRSPAEIQQLINSATEQKSVTNISESIASQQLKDSVDKKVIGDSRWYQHAPGNLVKINYPLILKTAENHFRSDRKPLTDQLPFIFTTSKKTENKLELRQFSPGKILLTANFETPDDIVVQQMNHNGWRLKINAKKSAIKTNEDEFQTFSIPNGKSEIMLEFKNPAIVFFLIYSAIIFSALSGFLLILHFRKTN